MGVKLSDFANRIIQERKLIRANKGPSIVPLMIVRFIGFKPAEDDYYNSVPKSGVMLLTVCQRTGTVCSNADLTKIYSASGYVGYTDWWNRSEVISIRPPSRVSKSRLLEINVDIKEVNNHDREHLTW